VKGKAQVLAQAKCKQSASFLFLVIVLKYWFCVCCAKFLFFLFCFGGCTTTEYFHRDDLWFWGGTDNTIFHNHQYWRLVTNLFLNRTFDTLIGYSIFFLVGGIYFETTFGIKKFLFTFLVTGLIASICTSLWNGSIIATGLSAIIICQTTIICIVTFKNIKHDLTPFIYVTYIISTLYIFGVGSLNMEDNTSNIVGFFLGICFSFTIQNKNVT
jgi:rhomboid protease GluP